MTDTQPSFVERRSHPDTTTLLMLLNRNQESQQETLRQIGELSSSFKAHVESERITIAQAIQEGVVLACKGAFPEGNAEQHREWHQSEIEVRKRHEIFVQRLLLEVGKWAVVALTGWIGYALWQAFLKGPM